MGKRIGMVVLAVAITAALIASTVLYKVDETSDIIVVKEFGAIKAVKSGTADAGLHFKWPWPIQTTVRYDK